MIASKKTCLTWLTQQEEGLYEVRKADPKRTKSQNNFYRALLGQLAGELGLTNDEMHFFLLKRYSTESRWATFDNVDLTNAKSFKYREEYAREGNVVYYKVWKPSSEMSKKEFKRLLDGLIDECKNVGIDTATEAEKQLLEEGY